MRRPRRPTNVNVTFRLHPDVVFWARLRALYAGTSVNRLIRDFLTEYAAVPQSWWTGEEPFQPPRPAVETFAQVMDPRGAGERAWLQGVEAASRSRGSSARRRP
jgi:hypothetical protein